MNTTSLEQELLGTFKQQHKNEAFIAKTMQAISRQQTQKIFGNTLSRANAPAGNRIFRWLRQLPVALAIAVIVASVVGLSGMVYAAVRYVPALVKVTESTETARGTKAYWAPGFKDCTSDGTQRFEVRKDAPALSEADVQSIIQARCETDTAGKFVQHAWPTYGANKVWKTGDLIYYAQPANEGSLQKVSSTSVTVSEYSGNTLTSKMYKVQAGKTLTVYANGVQVPLSSLHKNDTVYVINRISEKYTDFKDLKPIKSEGSIQYMTPGGAPQPKPVGTIGLIKLSQPLRYYGTMQNYLTELPPCMGNAGEFCPSTGSIDVFPRVGGEGASNPDLVMSSKNVYRQISGTVTSLDDTALTLKSSSGKLYSVTAPQGAFADYSTNYAPVYGAVGVLKIGTSVSVRYSQPAGAKAQTITPNQIMSVELMLEGDIKGGKDTQY